MKQRLVVGLGNPGTEYAMTRHNIGFLVVQAFAEKYGWGFKKESRFSAFVAKGKVEETTVHLLMPTTYMNESGTSVGKYSQYYKIGPQQLLIVSDDASLDFGRLRLRERGSSGGHNGLKSVEACLGTSQYPRLRLGIGEDKRRSLTNYVLGKFVPDEVEELPLFVDRAVQIVERWLVEAIEAIMNDANATRRVCEEKKQIEE